MPRGSSGNRPPTPAEMQTCLPYLAEQIDIIQPKVLVALGATAVEGLLGTRGTMREMRGRWHSHQETPLMITYHPSYLLRNQAPSEKRKVWEDMLQVLERIGAADQRKAAQLFPVANESERRPRATVDAVLPAAASHRRRERTLYQFPNFARSDEARRAHSQHHLPTSSRGTFTRASNTSRPRLPQERQRSRPDQSRQSGGETDAAIPDRAGVIDPGL